MQRIHLLYDGFKVEDELFSRQVVVKAKMESSTGSSLDQSLYLSVAGISSGRDKYGRLQILSCIVIKSGVFLHSQLVECHGIVCTLKHIYIFCIFQFRVFGTCHP